MSGPAARDALDALESHRDRLLQAADRAESGGELEIAARILLAVQELLIRRGPARWSPSRIDRMYRRLSEAPAGRVDPGVVARVAIARAIAMRSESSIAAIEEAAHAAAEASRAAAEPGLRARAALTQAYVFARRAAVSKAHAAVVRARREARDQGDPSLDAVIAAAQLSVALMAGDAGAARDVLADQADVLEDCPDPSIRIRVLGARALLATARGNHPGAIEFYLSGHAIAAEVGDLSAQARLNANLGGAYRSVGRYEEAATAFRRAEQWDTARGDGLQASRHLSNQGVLAVDRGRPKQALEMARRALAVQEAGGDVRSQGFSRQLIGEALIQLQQFPEAAIALEAAYAVWESVAAPMFIERFQILAALAAAREGQGENQAALQYARRALELAIHAGLAREGRDRWMREAWARVDGLLSR